MRLLSNYGRDLGYYDFVLKAPVHNDSDNADLLREAARPYLTKAEQVELVDAYRSFRS